VSNSFATIVLLGNPLGTCDNCGSIQRSEVTFTAKINSQFLMNLTVCRSKVWDGDSRYHTLLSLVGTVFSGHLEIASLKATDEHANFITGGT
jgi:hypothetical protein